MEQVTTQNQLSNMVCQLTIKWRHNTSMLLREHYEYDIIVLSILPRIAVI